MHLICSVDGCEKPPRGSEGLCGMHRQRMMRYGDVNAVKRPAGWGKGHGHPLYERWRSMRRGGRFRGGNVERWDTFMNFVEDVGELPSPDHKLIRLRDDEPYGPANFAWRSRVADAKMSVGDRASKAAYMRQYNADNPLVLKRAYLKQQYGISLEDYLAMFEGQDGRCAICGEPESAVNNRTGETYLLAVDHDHATGKVRALLCMRHNRGLGLFGDSIKMLKSAIAYLERHSNDGEFVA